MPGLGSPAVTKRAPRGCACCVPNRCICARSASLSTGNIWWRRDKNALGASSAIASHVGRWLSRRQVKAQRTGHRQSPRSAVGHGGLVRWSDPIPLGARLSTGDRVAIILRSHWIGDRCLRQRHQYAMRSSTRTETMQRFTMEVTELRALGFAEGLPIGPPHHARDIVARLKSGRIGVAVEFRAREGTPTYAVIPLLAEGSHGSAATDIWGDIVCDIRRRALQSDNE
jgi:hypothetical protein